MINNFNILKQIFVALIHSTHVCQYPCCAREVKVYDVAAHFQTSSDLLGDMEKVKI